MIEAPYKACTFYQKCNNLICMYDKFTFLVLIECKVVINDIITITQKGYNVMVALVQKQMI